MLAIGPRHLRAFLQPQVDLVHERGGLEGVAGGFLLEVVRGQAAQIGVGALDGLAACVAVAARPAM